MKHLKQYEELNDERIDIGQYVIISLTPSSSDNDTIIKIHAFIDKNIGQIVNNSDNGYVVKYDEIPDFMKFLSELNEDKYGKNTIVIGYLHTPNITHASTKEELYPYIQANKYNL